MIISMLMIFHVLTANATDGVFTIEQFKSECIKGEERCRANATCWRDRTSKNASTDSVAVCDCNARNLDRVTDKRKLNVLIESRPTEASELQKYLDGVLRGSNYNLGRSVANYANALAVKCESNPSFEVPNDATINKMLSDINETVISERASRVRRVNAPASEAPGDSSATAVDI